MAKVAYVVIGHDPDPDFSWLEQDCYDPRSPAYERLFRGPAGALIDPDWYRDPANHVALEVIAYDADGEVIDALGGIDFLADDDAWRTGEFHRLSQIGDSYLRDIARGMGLGE